VLRGFARPNLHLSARSIDGPRQARGAVIEALASSVGEPKVATRRRDRLRSDAPADRAVGRAAGRARLERGRLPRRDGRRCSLADRRSLRGSLPRSRGGYQRVWHGHRSADIRAVVHVQPPASIEGVLPGGRPRRPRRRGSLGAPSLLRGRHRPSATTRHDERRWIPGAAGGGGASLGALSWTSSGYVDARTCRHDFILRYFGDEQETLGGCGHCDICSALDGADAAPADDGERTATVVRMALSAVARARGRAGMGAVADMLRGSTTSGPGASASRACRRLVCCAIAKSPG